MLYNRIDLHVYYGRVEIRRRQSHDRYLFTSRLQLSSFFFNVFNTSSMHFRIADGRRWRAEADARIVSSSSRRITYVYYFNIQHITHIPTPRRVLCITTAVSIMLCIVRQNIYITHHHNYIGAGRRRLVKTTLLRYSDDVYNIFTFE